jgi:ParB/RepB/Spo0J family partition protein
MTKTVELPIAKSGAVESAIVREIPLEQLEASRNNPRRTMNETDLTELAASIREHGVNVPLLVRPWLRAIVVELDNGTEYDFPGLSMAEASPYIDGSAEIFQGHKVVRTEVEDTYEIVCGRRRSEAATLAGLTSVPCIVRDMTDEQAAEIALIDNLQRVDVPPLEEAAAFDELLARLGSIAAVAARVGKEQSYIAKRLKLCTLTCWSADALRKKLITIDHALLLARLASDEQNEALKWTLDRNAGSKTPVSKVVDWSDAADRGYMGSGKKLRKPGETLQVCIAVGCKAHKKDYEKGEDKSGGNDGDSAAAKKAQREIEHRRQIEREIRHKIVEQILQKISDADALRLATHEMGDTAEVRKALLKSFPDLSGNRLEVLTLFLIYVAGPAGQPSGWMLADKKQVAKDRAKLWDLAKLVGVDPDIQVSNFFFPRGIDPVEDPLKVTLPRGQIQEANEAREEAHPDRSCEEADCRGAKKGGRK